MTKSSLHGNGVGEKRLGQLFEAVMSNGAGEGLSNLSLLVTHDDCQLDRIGFINCKHKK